MKVFYSTLGMYVGAGEAVFSASWNGSTVNRLPPVGDGKTYSFFDNFFKVRDRYESYVDTTTMLPYKFRTERG